MPQQSKSKYAFLPAAALFWAAGLGFFVWLNMNESDLKQKLTAIENGEGTPITLVVDQKWVQPGSGSGSDRGPDSHWISFAPVAGYPEDIDRSPSFKEWQTITLGRKYEAHLVLDDVVVKEMDTLQPKAKWVMLGFCLFLGMIPMSITGYNIMRSPDN